MQIHDPAIIQEREHRHMLHFKYRRRANGEVESDFDLDNAPALAFAARATSSFPGAFPPAQIAEMDELVRETRRGLAAPRGIHRAEFRQLYLRADIDPTSVPFIDGSVLNNRPFHEAISAIPGRPAYREVDRRIVYIDPDPAPPAIADASQVPGFFATLKGALSDIPRTEPVTDELSWVIEFNERARRLQAIIERARPQVSHLVAERDDRNSQEDHRPAQIRAWREQVNVTRRARRAASPMRAMSGSSSPRCALSSPQMIMSIRGVPARSPFARAIAEIIDAWAARRRHRLRPRPTAGRAQREAQTAARRRAG